MDSISISAPVQSSEAINQTCHHRPFIVCTSGGFKRESGIHYTFKGFFFHRDCAAESPSSPCSCILIHEMSVAWTMTVRGVQKSMYSKDDRHIQVCELLDEGKDGCVMKMVEGGRIQTAKRSSSPVVWSSSVLRGWTRLCFALPRSSPINAWTWSVTKMNHHHKGTVYHAS